tara:strand:+ start:6376 stop:6837 length:462 start_codon:yes stop_codon:yes gene_type:complete
MANVSLLAADGETPKASMLGKVGAGERPATDSMVIKVTHSDIPTAANTYILGRLPVGAAVTNAFWIVTTQFSDGIDIGISNSAGAAGTDGNVDVLQDDSVANNHTVGIYPANTHASNNYPGHLCTTDSYIVASAAGDLTAGVGTLVVEYIETL